MLGTGGEPAAARDEAPRKRAFIRRRWWREILLAVGIYELYNIIQARLTGHAGEALHNGAAIMRWEHRLHLDPEPALNRLFTSEPVIGLPASYWYASLHFMVTAGVLLFVYHTRSDRYPHARAVLALMTLAALLVFWRFPTAPPRMLLDQGFHDTGSLYSKWGWWGDDALPRHASRFENQFAAMPSLHVAWATWSAVTLMRATRKHLVRILAGVYAVGTVVVVLGTANHYLADAVAGLLLWLAAEVVVAAVRRASGSGSLRGRLFRSAGEITGRDAQRQQQTGQQHDVLDPSWQLLVVGDDADGDAEHGVDRRRRRQARRERPRLERDLVQQQTEAAQQQERVELPADDYVPR